MCLLVFFFFQSKMYCVCFFYFKYIFVYYFLVQQPRFEDTVRSGCTSTGWNISLDVRVLQSIYPGITAYNIYLGPSKCTGEQHDTELWFKQSFNECMTSEKVWILNKNLTEYSVYNKNYHGQHDLISTQLINTSVHIFVYIYVRTLNID
jgi:hypothetical protein